MSATLNLGTDGNWATKKDTILAYNDENSNFKPLAFNFERDTLATRVNKDGLIETVGSGEPRIDYKDDIKGALLLEPSRTNSLLQSNQFDTNWIGSSTSVLSGYLGLDGTNSAWLLTKTASSFANIRQNITFSGIHTFSVYLKKGTNTSAILRSTGGNDAKVEINLIDGTTSGETNTISVETKSMGNDWWRCSMTLDASSNTAVRIYPEAPLGGVTAGNIYIQYAQLEQGSYATSYIPTQGGVVTRLADECEQIPPDGVIGQTELTIFYQGIVERLGGNDGHAITLSQSADGAGSSRILLYRNSSNGNMYVYIQDTTTQFSTPLLANSNPQINDKYAIAIKDNDLVVYCNGVKVSENNSGTIPDTQYLILNKWNNQINEQNKIKEVKLYNTRLSNSELQALTSN